MKKKVERQEEQMAKRITDLLTLNTGKILGMEKRSSFDIIIAEKMAILTSPRGTFIHHNPSPEYLLYKSTMQSEATPEMIEDGSFEAFRESMFISPMVYFFMHENSDFHGHCAMQFLSMLNELLTKVSENIEENPEAGEQYLNEQRVLNVVLNMLENDVDKINEEKARKQAKQPRKKSSGTTVPKTKKRG